MVIVLMTCGLRKRYVVFRIDLWMHSCNALLLILVSSYPLIFTSYKHKRKCIQFSISNTIKVTCSVLTTKQKMLCNFGREVKSRQAK